MIFIISWWGLGIWSNSITGDVMKKVQHGAASAAEELESSVPVTCMSFYIGGNYSECLLGYIKLLTSTNKYYTLGCCGSCVPNLSRLSKGCWVERQSQSQILNVVHTCFSLVHSNRTFCTLFCTSAYPFRSVFWCFILVTASTSHFTGFFFLMP